MAKPMAVMPRYDEIEFSSRHWGNRFSSALARYMDLTGITQRRLAKESGIGLSSIHRIVNAVRVPKESTVRKILAALDRITVVPPAIPEWPEDSPSVARELSQMDPVVGAVYAVTGVHLGRQLSRHREVSDARFIAAKVFNTRTPLYYRQIGVLIGSRDHSSVIHAINRAGELIETCPEFRRKYERVLELLDNRRPELYLMGAVRVMPDDPTTKTED